MGGIWRSKWGVFKQSCQVNMRVEGVDGSTKIGLSFTLAKE